MLLAIIEPRSGSVKNPALKKVSGTKCGIWFLTPFSQAPLSGSQPRLLRRVSRLTAPRFADMFSGLRIVLSQDRQTVFALYGCQIHVGPAERNMMTTGRHCQACLGRAECGG